MEQRNDDLTPFNVPLQEDERSSKRRRISPRPAREVGLMRSDIGDTYSGFVGSASGIFFIRSVYGAMRCSQPETHTAGVTPGSDIVPGEDDHLPLVHQNSSGSLWKEDEVDSGLSVDFSFQDLVGWTASYFANFHPYYPFLHAPSILEYFNQVLRSDKSNDRSDDFSMIILRSIMSISVADYRQSNILKDMRRPPRSLVFASYDAAVDSLRYVLSRPTSLLSLQAAVSVQLFLVSMLRLNAASRLGGLVIRMAVQLGLHRCPGRFSSFSASERELRQRVFWSIYVLDRFICQSMGLPLGLNDDDVDVCYPLSEQHHTQTNSENRLRLLHLLAQHSRIRGEIIELRNKSVHYVQKDPDRETAITARLTEWWNDVQEYNDTDGQNAASDYPFIILTMLKHESIISLYRPILAASHRDARYDAALHQCIGSARIIITTLHQAINLRPGISPETSTLSLLWPSCTWAVWISTFILFYAANGKHVSRDIVARLAGRSIEVLQHLARRGSAWPEASATAIRDLLVRMTQPPIVPSNTAHINTDASYQQHNRICVQDTPLPRPLHDPVATSDVTPERSAQPVMNHEAIISTGPPNSDRLPASNLDYNPSQFTFPNEDWNDFIVSNGPYGQDAMFGEHNSLDPFSGFDIPFWFEEEQHWDMLQ